MNQTTKKILLIIITIALIIILTPAFGSLYEKIIGRQVSAGFFGLDNPEYFEGFFMAYAFFVTLVTILFFTSKRNKILSLFLGALFLLNIISGTWKSLMVNIGTIIIAIILAQIIKIIYKKFKK
jgi:hypothetical protein